MAFKNECPVEVCSLFPSRQSFLDSPRQFASPLPMISVVDQSLPPEIQQRFLTFCPDACTNPSPSVAQSFILYVFMRQNRVQNRACEKSPPRWEVLQSYLCNRPPGWIIPEINIKWTLTNKLNWYTMHTVLSDQTSDFSEVQGKCPQLLLRICFSVGFAFHMPQHTNSNCAAIP